MTNQKGFAPILIVVLLLAGVGLGAYYIQQNTSLFPRAENNAPRTDTGSCRDNPMDPPSTPSSENFNYKWLASCSTSCSQNSDCPQNNDDPDRVNPGSSNWCFGFGDGTNKCLKLIAVDKGTNQPSKTTTGRDPSNSSSSGSGSCQDNPPEAKQAVDALNKKQTGKENFDYYWKVNCSASCSNNSDCAQNTDDPDRVNPGTSNWCYGFGGNVNRCMKLIAVNKGTTTPAKTTTGRNPAQTSFGGTTVNGSSNGSGASGSTSGSTSACTTQQTQQIANTYYDAKVAQRYARYTAIMKGAQEYCVQADLGVEPAQRRDSADGAVKNGRLYLCSRKDNSEATPKLVWRVISDNGADIRALTTEDPDVSKSEVESVMGKNIEAAKKALGL